MGHPAEYGVLSKCWLSVYIVMMILVQRSVLHEHDHVADTQPELLWSVITHNHFIIKQVIYLSGNSWKL